MDIFQIVRFHEVDNYNNYIDKIDVNVLDEDQRNLLHEAIASKNTWIVNDLLNRGIDVNHQDKQGNTPLHFAADYDNLKVARAIIEHGGDVNICNIHGNNALWTAVLKVRTHYDMVKLFSVNGGDPHHKNKHGRSPMDMANQYKIAELIELLEKYGSQI